MPGAILILGNNDAGLYDFRKEVIAALLQEGYRVHVSVPDTGYVDKIKAIGCICHETQMERRGMNPIKDIGLFRFYRKLIREINPEVVLTYTIKPNIYGGFACRITKTPYLVNITGLGTALENEGILQKLLVFMYREGLEAADCIFFQNRGNRDFMMEKGCVRRDAKTKLIAGSGVNLMQYRFHPYPKEDTVHFLSVMRIMKDKGIEELLEAAQIIHQEYPKTVFEILGPYEEETRALYEPRIEALQQQGIVRYLGWQDEMESFYGRCQAVVHPSYHEGMSNVLQEAAACGRPVIASNISGCKEIFEDGISGIAFRPKDAKSLADAIRSFLALPVRDRARMGKRAREYVEENFDRNKVVAAYLDTIKDIAAS